MGDKLELDNFDKVKEKVRYDMKEHELKLAKSNQTKTTFMKCLSMLFSSQSIVMDSCPWLKPLTGKISFIRCYSLHLF